jgi:Nitroreductase family
MLRPPSTSRAGIARCAAANDGLLLARTIAMDVAAKHDDPEMVLTNAVAAAIMAPSTHNSQPWRFRIVDDTLELYADSTRRLGVIDADRRQLVQSCGCALYNARVAVRAMGYTEVVTEMVTDQMHHELLATLRLGDPHITSDRDHELVRALAVRRTNRRPFLPRPVAAADAQRLADAAVTQGAWLVRLTPHQKYAIGRVVEEADQRQFASAAFRSELVRWLVPFGSTRKDGIPFVEKEYGSSLPFTVLRALRSPQLGETFGAIEEARVDASPFVAVIGTRSDDPIDWLSAGQALEAVLLHATTLGLSACFLNQALEIPELRAKVGEVIGARGYPHMILRLGYASAPVRHAAPRRALADVLRIADALDDR